MNKTGYITFILLWSLTVQAPAQSDYTVAPLTLNSRFTNEIFAVPYKNGVIYCSDRRTNVLINRVDTADNPLFHLYFAPAKDSIKWSIPRLLSKNIPLNTHQGPCTVSANGQELYFTANNETGQRIYSARNSGDEWINIQPFTHNRPNYTTTHPSLSPDGKRLFFASDRPGGYGGFDIYVCEWTLSGWGTPKNLGPEVNTAEDELYPFIQGNGVLYFSSSAHNSMGGMDIFSVRETDGKWGLRQRLEEPVNSTGDDISYTAADADGTSGYIVSNRNGQNFDIFSFKSLFPVFTECQEQEENDYTYRISEQGAMKTDTTTLKLIWEMGDGTTRYGEEFWHTFPSTGQYDIYLNVLDTLTGEFSEHVKHYLLDVLDEEQPYITVGETVVAGVPVPFDASKTCLPELDIEEYYWMFGDGGRDKGERVEHVFAGPGVYRVQLGVTGKSIYTEEPAKVCTFLEITVK